jgi:hypothetical protein
MSVINSSLLQTTGDSAVQEMFVASKKGSAISRLWKWNFGEPSLAQTPAQEELHRYFGEVAKIQGPSEEKWHWHFGSPEEQERPASFVAQKWNEF